MYNQTLYILQKEKREIIMVRKLKKIKKQLLGASKMHKKQATTIGKMITKKKNVKKRA
jgi:hypothetical protein|tara:strand:- start:458 stop:631 length:174 start_codon:yes stop_codon:yes gene_type:complete